MTSAEKKLIILDYDGTLRDFVDSTKPEKAMPSKEIIKLLKQLSSDESSIICIVSGRTKEALDLWFGKLNMTLVAEHGAWIKKDGKWHQTQSSFDDHKTELLQLMQRYAKRTTGAKIEVKSHSLVWHYRNVKTELAYARNVNLIKDIEKYIKDTDLSVFQGNKILEIKPESINKGIFAKQIYESTNPDFTLCIGDDYTDEDMFDILPEEAFTIKVGLEESEALFQLKDVESVYRFLLLLTEN